jgi:hypothetical protein
MKFLGLTAVLIVAIIAALVLFSVLPRSPHTADTVSAGIPTRTPAAPTPQPTPAPSTWIDGLSASRHGVAILVSCLDRNHDGRIDGADGGDYDQIDIPVVSEYACIDPAHHSDFYVGDPAGPAAYACDGGPAPLLIVAIGSAGTDLFDSRQGESLGVLDIVNQLQARASAAGIASVPMLSASAIFGAEQPQTRNEQWLANEIERRLDAMPCLRAVLIGHSHGGVTVTSVTSDLDAGYAGRIFGVLIDRTNVLYDREATEVPVRIPLLNVFQTNEGWHGIAYGQENITNVDESAERAPVAPSDGGGGLALVSHKTLDDAVAVQGRIVTAVMAWVESGTPAIDSRP